MKSLRVVRTGIPRHWLHVMLAGLLLAMPGCGTPGLDSRRHERSKAYAALSPESRALVDQGKIAPGMAPEAVYIAWGKPDKIVEADDPAGATTTWFYISISSQTQMRTGVMGDNHTRIKVVPYVRAKVVFQKGTAKSFEEFPPAS